MTRRDELQAAISEYVCNMVDTEEVAKVAGIDEVALWNSAVLYEYELWFNGDDYCEEEDEKRTYDCVDAILAIRRPKDLIGGVATFNADPFYIEDETIAKVVFDAFGGTFSEIDDECEFALAARQLDLDGRNPRHIYSCGNCKMVLPCDLN